MKHCAQCKHHKQGYCNKKKFFVSYNANWCMYFKRRFFDKLFNKKI